MMLQKVILMTMQVTDPFFWEDDEWIFLGADDVYSLFDPQSFGLSPTSMDTACWKGFVVSFRTVKNKLYLDRLEIYCSDNRYPPINNIESVPNKWGYRIYENIHLPLQYSGTIIIGKDLIERFYGRAFIGPHAYKVTFELSFDNGELISKKETSGTYKGF